MTMFPVNINTSSTGHKLQGRSKDIIIVTSWPKLKNNICFRNWEYVVLSRVRTRKGLFLFHPIDMEQSFKPTDELVHFMKRAERMESTLLQKRHNATRHWISTKTTNTIQISEGLFLFHPIDMEESFKPTDELVRYMKRAKRMESTLLQKRHNTTRHWSSTKITNTIQLSVGVVVRVIHRNNDKVTSQHFLSI